MVYVLVIHIVYRPNDLYACAFAYSYMHIKRVIAQNINIVYTNMYAYTGSRPTSIYNTQCNMLRNPTLSRFD